MEKVVLLTYGIHAVALLQTDVYHPLGEGGLTLEPPHQDSRDGCVAVLSTSPIRCVRAQ